MNFKEYLNEKLTQNESEIGTAYYIALLSNFIKGNLKKEHITFDNMNFVKDNVIGGKSFKSVYAEMDRNWRKSNLIVANLLYDNGFLKQNQDVHFRSGLTSSIARIFRKFNLKMDINKWNPSDIWIADKELNGNTIKSYINSSSISAFNISLEKLFDERILVGVSLKQIKKTPKITIFNKDNNKISFRPFKFRASGSGTSFFKNEGVSFYSSSEKVVGRTFKNDWSFQARGTSTASGKCGFNSVKRILKNNNINIPNGFIEKVIENKADKMSEEFIREFYQLYLKFDEKKEFSFNEFYRILNNKKGKKNFVFSKFIGLKFFEMIKNSPKEQDILNEITLYCYSATPDSSVFVKVYD